MRINTKLMKNVVIGAKDEENENYFSISVFYKDNEVAQVYFYKGELSSVETDNEEALLTIYELLKNHREELMNWILGE